jgi:hypothetical protein
MTNKEIVNRNIGLTFDFVKQIIDNPTLAEQLPDNCEIDFIEKDFTSKNKDIDGKKYLVRVKNSFELVKGNER